MAEELDEGYASDWEGCPKHAKKGKACRFKNCLRCPRGDCTCELRHVGEGLRGRHTATGAATSASSDAAAAAAAASTLRERLERRAKPVESFQENPTRKSVDFAQLVQCLGLDEKDVPLYLRQKTSTFSQQTSEDGGTQEDRVKRVTTLLFDALAACICDENPDLIKSLVAENWRGFASKSAEVARAEQIIRLLADLATRTPDEEIRRAILAVLYEDRSRASVGDELKQARSRAVESGVIEPTKLGRGIGQTAMVQAQRDLQELWTVCRSGRGNASRA